MSKSLIAFVSSNPVRPWFALFFITGLLVFASAVSADQVVLKDGSKIVGQVQDLIKGKIRIKTKFAAEINFDWSQVKSISIDKPVVVVFMSGQKQPGLLKHDAKHGHLLTTSDLGVLFVPLDQISAIFRAEGPKVAPDTAKQIADAQAQAKQQAAGEKIPTIKDFAEKPRWRVRAHLGVNGQTGNSERISVIGRFEANSAYKNERFKMYAQTRFVEEDGVRTANETFGGTDWEIDFNKHWFVFEKNFAETDEFELLDLRLRFTTGIGHFLVRKPDRELKLYAGVGYQHEKFETGDREDGMIAEVGITYKRQLSPWFALTHATTYYPSLENRRDYRIVSETAGEFPIDKAKQWKVRVGIRSEFDDSPLPSVERLDSYYFLTLVLDF